MSSDVISKTKVVVLDDFFNEIVDGLKNPVEEKIEKRDANESRTTLGGKLLALFKGKVAPIVSKEIEKNGILEVYTEEVLKSYYTIRIHDVLEAFQESVGEYKQIDEETDDELEEIESDDKSWAKFIYKGFKLYKTYRQLKSIYNIIQEIRSHVKPADNSSFDLSEYDLKSKLGRELAGDDLIVYLNENLVRFVPAFEPLIRKTSDAIWAGAYKTFDKFNTAIYWMIAKEIAIWAAIEAASWLVGMFTFGAGYAAGKIAQAGRIAMFMNKIKKIASVGLGIAKLTKTIKGTRVVRALGVNAYKAGRLFRTAGGRLFLGGADKILGHVLRHRKAYWNAYKVGMAGYVMVDILNVDQEDLDEVHEWAKEKFKPIMEDTYKEYGKIKLDYDTIEEISDVFGKLNEKMKQNISDVFSPPTNPELYEGIVKFKNLNFDFNSVENLGKLFSQGWSTYQFYWLFGVIEKNDGFWDLGDGYIFDLNNSIIQLQKDDNTTLKISPYKMITEVHENGIVSESSEIKIKKHSSSKSKSNIIKLDDKVGRKGTDILFGKFGEFLQLKTFYKFKYKGKWYDKIGYENWLHYYYAKKLTVYTSLYYKNRNKGDKRVFKVESKGDVITVAKVSKLAEYNYKLKNEKNTSIDSVDLSEIVIFKNKTIEDEIEFGKKVDSLLKELEKLMEKPRIQDELIVEGGIDK